MNKIIITVILVALLAITSVIVYQFLDQQFTRMRIIETGGQVYHDCINDAKTTWSECQMYRDVQN